MIDTMHQSTRRANKCTKTRKLYKSLHDKYSISLSHIPRKENSTAHKLARTEYVPQPNFYGTKSLYGRNRSFDERKTMLLDDVLIPNCFKYGTPPREDNYQFRLQYYQQYGGDYKTIRVDANGVLYEGYITYLILKEQGVTECFVDVTPDKTFCS